MDETILKEKAHQCPINPNVILEKVCPCGKPISACDCINCSKCGILFKPLDKQTMCKKCGLILILL